jgi:hypothetical protein
LKDHANGRLDHVAALVRFRDDAIRAVLAIERDRAPGPFDWEVFPAVVREHVTMIVDAPSGDDNPGVVRILADADSGIDRDHDPSHRRNRAFAAPRRFQQFPCPQRALYVIKDLGVQLLPSESRAFVPFDDLREKRLGEICSIVVCRPAG